MQTLPPATRRKTFTANNKALKDIPIKRGGTSKPTFPRTSSADLNFQVVEILTERVGFLNEH